MSPPASSTLRCSSSVDDVGFTECVTSNDSLSSMAHGFPGNPAFSARMVPSPSAADTAAPVLVVGECVVGGQSGRPELGGKRAHRLADEREERPKGRDACADLSMSAMSASESSAYHCQVVFDGACEKNEILHPCYIVRREKHPVGVVGPNDSCYRDKVLGRTPMAIFCFLCMFTLRMMGMGSVVMISSTSVLIAPPHMVAQPWFSHLAW